MIKESERERKREKEKLYKNILSINTYNRTYTFLFLFFIKRHLG